MTQLPALWVGFITLFPEMFSALKVGIVGRAQKQGLLSCECFNLRDFAQDKHRSVDDKPYGGGPGMLLMAEPLMRAIQAAKQAAIRPPKVIYLSPQGKPFTQAKAAELAQMDSVLFIAGRYEGIDERLVLKSVDEEWSLGDFILSGGELAAMTMIDAAARLIPGCVGDEESVQQDSLMGGLLKFPQYTRPEIFNDAPVPEVLLSGHHQKIQKWRLKQSLGRTWLKRPDLLEKRPLSSEEESLLSEFIQEFIQK